jgi:hypothetical protein
LLPLNCDFYLLTWYFGFLTLNATARDMFDFCLSEHSALETELADDTAISADVW